MPHLLQVTLNRFAEQLEPLETLRVLDRFSVLMVFLKAPKSNSESSTLVSIVLFGGDSIITMFAIASHAFKGAQWWTLIKLSVRMTNRWAMGKPVVFL